MFLKGNPERSLMCLSGLLFRLQQQEKCAGDREKMRGVGSVLLGQFIKPQSF